MTVCSFEETITSKDGSYISTKCMRRAEIFAIDDPCCGLCYTCAYNKVKKDNERLREALEDWLKHAESYDPYGPNGSARYGSGAAGIEKQGVIDKLKEILALKETKDET